MTNNENVIEAKKASIYGKMQKMCLLCGQWVREEGLKDHQEGHKDNDKSVIEIDGERYILKKVTKSKTKKDRQITKPLSNIYIDDNDW
jgi:hypothetical protein